MVIKTESSQTQTQCLENCKPIFSKEEEKVMGAVVCFIIILSLAFSSVGCWIYLTSLAELEACEEGGEEVTYPTPIARMVMCLFLTGFTIGSSLLLGLVGGKIISIIILIISLVFSGIFGFAMISGDALESSVAYGCALPFFSVMFTATVVFVKPNPIGVGILTLVFYIVLFCLWSIVKIKNRREEEDWLYDEEE